VTGAAGFVGRAALTALAQRGFVLRAAQRSPPRSPLPAGIEVVELPDLASEFDWKPLLTGVDRVIHLAAIADSGAADTALHDRVNRWATERLARAAAESGISRFVFISSIRAQQQAEVSFHAGPIKRDRPQDAEGYAGGAHRCFGREF
jgi:nucleoside-diphosphate-sugar epimerase